MGYFGMDIPKLGFGLMRLPKLDDGTNTDIEQVKRMVDAFMDAGGRYFDTARAYGSSEADIREALVERYPRESYLLATKNAAWKGAANAEEARAYFDTSLEQTGAGYFDFYLIHNTGGIRTKVFDDYGMWDFLAQLKAEGKVRHIGFSHHDSAEALEDILQKHPQMEFVQLQVNWADWENSATQSRKCVELARKYGKPVVVMEPVRGGTLANPPEEVARILRAADPNRSFADWALRFAMNVEGVMVVLSGMSDTRQMEENLRTWQSLEPLTDAEQEALQHARQVLETLLDNPCTACHYCMKGCPSEINIAGVMDMLNRRKLYGQEACGVWYSLNTTEGHRASDCIQCYQCEDVCPQHIEIVEKLERAADYFE